MNLIRTVIADDDQGMRMVMRKIVEKAEGYELVGEAENGQELLDLYEKTQPQVAILDVEMPVMDGISCAKALQDINPRILVIFATAHDCYMGDAFELYAFDYLLKPFRVERAMQTLEKARERLVEPVSEPPVPVRLKTAGKAPTRLMLRHKDGVSFVDMDDILLVQREERMTVVYAKDEQRYVTSEALGDLELRLPEDMFFRCHKSYIVNINHIDSITPYGRWTYVIKMLGTKRDALITHERFEALEKMFL